MNSEHGIPEFQSLDSPLDAAVQAVLAEPLPKEAVERVKVRAKQLADVAAAPPRGKEFVKRRRPAFRLLIGSAIAAVTLLALAIGSNLLFERSAARAFAQVVEKVKAANSVRFRMTQRLDRQPEFEGRVLLEGNRMRTEQFHGRRIQIADFDQRRVLSLDTNRKLAQSTELNAKMAELLANPIDQLRRAKTNDAQSIGEEILDGRRSIVYRLRKFKLLGIHGDVLLWVDAKTELPAKMVIRDSNPKYASEVRLDEFVWNEPIEAGLFALDVPAGFQAGVLIPTPRPEKPLPRAESLDSPNVSRDGILSRDRVPGRIVWSADGTTLTALMRDPETVPAGARRQNELRQWQVATGKLRWRESVEGADSLAITADGKMLATTIDHEAQLRRAATGEIIRQWETETALPPVAFSRDTRFLAVGISAWGQGGAKEAGGVQIFDAERGVLVRSIADDKPTTLVSYSIDGKFVASASNGGPVKLWDAATGELARIFPGTTAAFAPSDGAIACASTEWKKGHKEGLGKVTLFDLKTASILKSFVSESPTATSWLLQLAFSQDGRLLAGANWDGTVTLWNVATGQREQTITDDRGGVHTAVFSPDGATLATGSEDKTLHLLKLSANRIRPKLEK